MSIARLEHFFKLIDEQELFDPLDPEASAQLRTAVINSLVSVLIDNRSQLEQTRGPAWPFLELDKRLSFFEKRTTSAYPESTQMQAWLFLHLLPFAGQWQRLQRPHPLIQEHPELVRFFDAEALKIKEKIKQKDQKEFKLRHFLQILKKPNLPEEKGVLAIFALPYVFLNEALLCDISRWYFIFIEPPMGAIFRHTWWHWFAGFSSNILFGLGGEEDRHFVNRQINACTTHLAHGAFLDHRVATPDDFEKTYDIVFNATFDDMPRKRHARMLQLLTDPLLQDKTCLFLGRGQPSNVQHFRQMVTDYELNRRVTVFSNLQRQEVPALLAQCTAGVHLSRYENECRCIYEYFRSDLPCVIPSSMAGMNQRIFNSQTGMAVMEKDLAKAISHVLNHRRQFTPRRWFLENTGSQHSTEQLNTLLKKIFRSSGYTWRTDIVPMTSSGASRYLHPTDYLQFKNEYKALYALMKRHRVPVHLVDDFG